jgi:hypothetical protein
MKRLLLALFMFLSAGLLRADSSTLVIRRPTAATAAAGVDTSDVPFYWNMDSATSGISPQKGFGTITIGASWTSVTGSVSNAVDNNNAGNAAGRITISTWTVGTSFNIDMSKGRVGFYFFPRETGAGADGDPIYGNGATSGAVWYWQNSAGTNQWKYKDKSINFTLTANTTQFVELAWDSAEATLGRPCEVFVDGISAGQCTTGSSGGDPAASSIRLGGIDGNGYSAWYDQMMISTNPVKDLYALRNTTSF